jgi:hypothetical protein
VNMKKPIYNFTTTTLTRVLSTLWIKNDSILIPERRWLQYNPILRFYLLEGARLGALLKRGFRYRVGSQHMQLPVTWLTSQGAALALRWAPDRPSRLITVLINGG